MSKRSIFYKVGAVALLLIIGGIMMIIGRGHTIYMDNAQIEYEGVTYESPYKITVLEGEESVAKLYAKERGSTKCIGQTYKCTLEIVEEKGGMEKLVEVNLKLPYNLDGILINLPAYLAGLPEEAYMTEFVIVSAEPEEDEEIITDDLLGDI